MLDGKGPFGYNVFKNPARITRQEIKEAGCWALDDLCLLYIDVKHNIYQTPFVPARISLHRPHELNAWNRLPTL